VRRTRARDPLVMHEGRTWWTSGVATAEDLDALEAEVAQEVKDASDRALEQPQPAPDTAMLHLFSPDVDPDGRGSSTRRTSLRSTVAKRRWWT
jgi:TPP-dependent pyruvate/acetoin dehydrogenase alpha subunit